jgi:crossover junction endodeoxyribonuclease RusA|tara:strand:+ start:2469 stop:2894 length:426 start_codon:yes stop_codon:yes gene_type:complete
MPITLEVYGFPAPQGSKAVYNGRVVEQSAKTLKPWRKAIADACHEWVTDDHEFLLGPVKIEIDFYLVRPPSVKMNKRAFPIVPPDIDKLCRSTLDGVSQGLNGKVGDGLIWGDDSLVVELIARKYYADDREPGATITITAL